MSNPSSPTSPTPTQAPAPNPRKTPATHEQKQKRRKRIRRVIAWTLVIGIVAGSAVLLRKFVFNDAEKGPGEIMTTPVSRGSIQSTVEGTGNARAKNSAVLAPEAGRTVLEVLVEEGMEVTEGQPLYNLDDAPAQESIRTAQENVRSAEDGVRSAQESVRTAEEGVITAQEGVTTAEDGVTTAENGVLEAEDNVQTARDAVTTAEEAVHDKEEEVLEAQKGVTTAEEGVSDAQKVVEDRQKELDELYEKRNELTIKAPQNGRLVNINQDIAVGKHLAEGDEVATLINDSHMRLSLYYSWAYEGKIQVGQSADITLPTSMSSYSGTVEKINYVRRVVPEGSVTFEVIFSLDNPGTLTEGMTASASLVDANGEAIYPYASGELEYSDTTKITVETSGPVEEVHLMNYATVTSGDVLVKLGDEDIAKEIEAKQESVDEAKKGVEDAQKGVETAQKNVTNARKAVEDAKKGIQTAQKGVETALKGVETAKKGVETAKKNVETAKRGVTTAQQGVTDAKKGVDKAQEAVDKANEQLAEEQKKLENYHVVSPIAGKVLSCTLVAGEPVESGNSVQIADTSQMIVDINVDERNVGYVSPGMMVDLQDQMDNYYMGIVEQVALTAKAENGVATFPATLVVDNPDGLLMSGSYLNYHFIASQSDDCLVVPVQAVMNVTLPVAMPDGENGENGEIGTLPEDGLPEGNPDDNSDFQGDENGEMLPEGEGSPDGETLPDENATPDDATLPEDGDASTEPLPENEEPLPDPNVDSLPAEDGAVEPVADNGGVRVQSLMAVSRVEVIGGSSSGAAAFGNDDTVTVCFVQGEPDDRATEADPSWQVPEGFFPVIVKTGLADDTNVEILSGLNEGDVVFTGYMTNSASSWG